MRKHRFYLFIIAGFVVAGIALQHPAPSQAGTDSQARAQAQAGRTTALAASRLGASSISGNLDGSATTSPGATSPSGATGNGITVALVSLHDLSLLPPPTTTTTTAPPAPKVTATATPIPARVTTPTTTPAVVVAAPAPAAPAAPAAPVAAAVPAAPGTPLGGVWAELRHCESGGNYAEDTGNGYYGAYQFSPITWTALGFPGLPSNASPAMQDQAAQELQARSGWGQWPACSRKLGL